jgi:hypothetical protein
MYSLIVICVLVSSLSLSDSEFLCPLKCRMGCLIDIYKIYDSSQIQCAYTGQCIQSDKMGEIIRVGFYIILKKYM